MESRERSRSLTGVSTLAALLVGIEALGLVSVASAALPAGWSNQDIGTSGGSASESGGVFTVSGDGHDIWGSSDAFHYVYQPLSGDGEMTAHVISNGSGSDPWAKGGVMIRETLDPNSKHAMMVTTDGGRFIIKPLSFTLCDAAASSSNCASGHSNHGLSLG
jgi:hypothetical protein